MGEEEVESFLLRPRRRVYNPGVEFSLEVEREVDGRWLAEVPEIPGVLAYGASADEATVKAETLALRVIADRLERGETGPQSIHLRLAA